MNRFIFGSISAAVVCMSLAVLARAADEEVDIANLPKPVADAISARFPGAKVISATKETTDDQVVYDIELNQDGRKYEMDIKADGTTIEVEKEIAAKDLPAAVASAVQAKYPNATVNEVMEVYKVADKKETLDHYEVVIETADKKELELNASPDGKSLKEEE